MEFNPFDYGFHRDPYPTYEWLRERAPVYHNQRMDFWALSRFDDVLAGLHDPATYTSTGGVAIEHTDSALKSMIELDPPEHTQMRKLIARRFTPRRIAELEPRVREWTSTLLDSLEGRSRFDVVHEFSALLPTTVVGTMLGIPPDRHDDARHWTDDLLTREPANPVPPPAAAEGAMNMAVMAHELSIARRARAADDILSVLVDAEIDGVPLSDEQVIGFCLLLIAGGHETTSKLIANGVRMFASHPEQRDAVLADPELMVGAIEELLRYTSPTQYMARTVTRDVELHGTVMPEGAKVALLLGSGNRDPREFDRPDDFDITRANPRILAFGHGAHVCLGAAVARLEARVALQEFLARYPRYGVDEAAIEFLHSGNVQGPTSVPVAVAVA
jgi:cytochrome P450